MGAASLPQTGSGPLKGAGLPVLRDEMEVTFVSYFHFPPRSGGVESPAKCSE